MLEDKAFKWVLERVYTYSRWNNNPFRLPSHFGSIQIGSNYKVRVENILHFLQDEAKVLEIVEGPSYDESKQPRSMKDLFDDSFETPPDYYMIKTLGSFEAYVNTTISQNIDQSADIDVRLSLDGSNLVLEAEGKKFILRSFKTELEPYKFISYLLSNPNQLITYRTAQTNADATGLKDSPSEFIRRYVTNSKVLKDCFFPVRNKADIKLTNPSVIKRSELDKVLKKLTAIKPQ
jgi:hypothetical protein